MLKKFSTASIYTVLIVIIFLISTNAYKQLNNRTGNLQENGSLIGGDFIAFYIGGKLYKENKSRLYDLDFQKKYRKQVFDEQTNSAINGELPFVYPPIVAYLFSKLSSFDFLNAFYLYSFISLLLSFLCLSFLAKNIGYHNSFLRVLILSLSFTPFFLNTILGGQASWLGICIFSIVYLFLKAERDFLAGAVIMLSYYKPPIFLFAVIYLSIKRGNRFVLGEIFGAALIIFLSYLSVGADGLSSFLQVVTKYTYGQELMEGVELPSSLGAGLFAIFTTYINLGFLRYSLFIFIFIFVLFYLSIKGRSDKNISALEYSLMVVASVAFSIQCIKYDLAILLVPIILILNDIRSFSRYIRLALFACIAGFYLEFLFRLLTVSSYTFSLSSFMFFPLIMTLMLALKKNKIK